MKLTEPFPRSLTAAGLALRGALGVATLVGVTLLPAPANALQGDDEPTTTVQPSTEELSVENPAEAPSDDDDAPGEPEDCPEGQLCENPDPCVGDHCGPPPPPPCPPRPVPFQSSPGGDEDCPPDPCPPEAVALQGSPAGDEDCPPDPCPEPRALSREGHGGREDCPPDPCPGNGMVELQNDRHRPDREDCPPDPCRELPWDADHGDRERDPEDCPEIECPDVREWLDHGPHSSLGQLEHWRSWYDEYCDDDEDPCEDRVVIVPHGDDEPTDRPDEDHPERPEHPDPEDCEPPERTPDPDPDPVDPPVLAEPTFTG